MRREEEEERGGGLMFKVMSLKETIMTRMCPYIFDFSVHVLVMS